MALNRTTPGVYITELPGTPGSIAGVSTGVTAFIGRAISGPVNYPVQVCSMSDYSRIFGGLWLESTMSYAVQDFFNNGGSSALIVRVYKNSVKGKLTNDGLAKVTLLTSLAVNSPVINLVAANPGIWANKLLVSVDYDLQPRAGASVSPTHTPTSQLFNLTIRSTDTINGKPVLSERYTGLSANSGDSNYLPKVLAAQSALLTVAKNEQGNWVVPGRPVLTVGNAASGGNDGDVPTNLEYQGNVTLHTGIYALSLATAFNILCIPPPRRGTDTAISTWQKAMQFCVERRAILLVDPPVAWATAAKTTAGIAKAAVNGLKNLGLTGTASNNAALYFPNVIAVDPLSNNKQQIFVPCGIVAGIMARTDVTDGVWKAPAGISANIIGITALQVQLTDTDNGVLNPQGINCLRDFAMYGPVIWGARTLGGSDETDDYKYVNVRRMALYIEQSLIQGLQWVVFEPNGPGTWSKIVLSITSFLQVMYQGGAFFGAKASQAFFVKCDSTTTTANDIENGIINISIGFAPVKPAEFVILTIRQMAGQNSI